jgi:hypothetical protein
VQGVCTRTSLFDLSSVEGDGVQISAQLAFWTTRLAECVEENVDERNRVGAVVLPSSHFHSCQGGWTEDLQQFKQRAGSFALQARKYELQSTPAVFPQNPAQQR